MRPSELISWTDKRTRLSEEKFSRKIIQNISNMVATKTVLLANSGKSVQPDKLKFGGNLGGRLASANRMILLKPEAWTRKGQLFSPLTQVFMTNLAHRRANRVNR
jgi:hypothetical protein